MREPDVREYVAKAQRAIGELYVGNMILQEEVALKDQTIAALMDELKTVREQWSNAKEVGTTVEAPGQA